MTEETVEPFAAYFHTYCFGPGTEVIDPLGFPRVLIGAYQMWGKTHQTLYSAVKKEGGLPEWVSQDVLMQQSNGWTLVRAK